MPDDLTTRQTEKRRALWRNVIFIALLLVGVGLGWIIGEAGRDEKNSRATQQKTAREVAPEKEMAAEPDPGTSAQPVEDSGPVASQPPALPQPDQTAEGSYPPSGLTALDETGAAAANRQKELDFRSPPATQDTGQAAPATGWRQFAALTPHNPQNLPRIVVVIDDVGPNLAQAREAMALPPAVTLAILPYADYAAELAREARIKGHEILVHLPMQPANDADPGPEAMLADLPEAEFNRRLEWNLAQIADYVGVNNHMGSQLTQDPVAMQRVLGVLKERDLIFLDSRTIATTIAADLSRAMQLPTLERDVFIDNELVPDKIRLQLQRAEDIARTRGSAILIGHPHKETLDVLRDWIETLEARGFLLVPLTAVLTEKG